MEIEKKRFKIIIEYNDNYFENCISVDKSNHISISYLAETFTNFAHDIRQFSCWCKAITSQNMPKSLKLQDSYIKVLDDKLLSLLILEYWSGYSDFEIILLKSGADSPNSKNRNLHTKNGSPLKIVFNNSVWFKCLLRKHKNSDDDSDDF